MPSPPTNYIYPLKSECQDKSLESHILKLLHCTAFTARLGRCPCQHPLFSNHTPYTGYTQRLAGSQTMFILPPSPLPVEPSLSDSQSLQTTNFSCGHTMPSAPLTRSWRKPTFTLRWTIILVPIIFVVITVITRFIAHPAVFDIFSPTSNFGWKSWSKSLTDWSLHEKHKATGSPLQPVVLSDTTPLPHVKRSTPAATPAPTVPTNPTLPTPFPQPYDTTLSSNFSTTSCYNFFLNMTQTDALRTCRPFSLLLTHSQAFITVRFSTSRLTHCSTSAPSASRTKMI